MADDSEELGGLDGSEFVLVNINAIRGEEYDKGYKEGYAVGKKEGFDEGYRERGGDLIERLKVLRDNGTDFDQCISEIERMFT